MVNKTRMDFHRLVRLQTAGGNHLEIPLFYVSVSNISRCQNCSYKKDQYCLEIYAIMFEFILMKMTKRYGECG